MSSLGFPLKMLTKNHGVGRPVARCQATGCREVTRWNKPYCTEHVELNPYAARVKDELASHLAELAEVRQRGAAAVDTRGLMSREMLRQLVLYGNRTVERLARDLGQDPELLHVYAKVLASEGTVTMARTPRGTTLLHLVPGVLERAAPARRARRRGRSRKAG